MKLNFRTRPLPDLFLGVPLEHAALRLIRYRVRYPVQVVEHQNRCYRLFGLVTSQLRGFWSCLERLYGVRTLKRNPAPLKELLVLGPSAGYGVRH